MLYDTEIRQPAMVWSGAKGAKANKETASGVGQECPPPFSLGQHMVFRRTGTPPTAIRMV